MRKYALIAGLLTVIGTGSFFAYQYGHSSTSPQVLRLYGNVDIRSVNLGFRTFGRIEQMIFEEGDRVSKGDLIAVLDRKPYEDEVNVAKAELEEATISYQNAEQTLNRKKALLQKNFASSQDFDDAQATRDELKAKINASKAKLQNAETTLQDTQVFSPAEGTILLRVKEPGAVVNPGDNVYVLSLDQPVWVRAYVSEPQLGFIYPGMSVNVYTDSHPDRPYKGQIGFISPTAEFTPKNVETEELRTQLVYRLRIIILKPDRALRQGMPVTVEIDRTQKAPTPPYRPHEALKNAPKD